MPLKVIITGATGMVGEGVLIECLESPDVQHVLSIVRKPTGQRHPKLTENIVPDFTDRAASKHSLKGTMPAFIAPG